MAVEAAENAHAKPYAITPSAFSGTPGVSQEELYTVDVQAGEEIYLIYQISDGVDLGGWFGYRNTVTYCIP